MDISSKLTYHCNFPKGTKTNLTAPVFEYSGDRWCVEGERQNVYPDTCLKGLTEMFGKPLDEVPGLELYMEYESYMDGFFRMSLTLCYGKYTYFESEIHMVEHAMSECPIDIAVGTPEGNVREAKKIWELLGKTPVDDNECIERIVDIPGLCYYAIGTHREEIWHDIEERYGVSVAYLMGQAKNPDGTDE